MKQNNVVNQMPGLRSTDIVWILSLYGTAIGAGVLFLPINAAVGGLIPLLVLAVIAFPMTFYAHQALCRFVLSGSEKDHGDITVVVEEKFGKKIGYLITLFYFLAIFPILLVYGVSIVNTVLNFIQYQLHMAPPARAIVAFVLISMLILIVQFGETLIVKTMSMLVYPFIIVLVLMALFLVPHWSSDLFQNVSFSGASNQGGNGLWLTLWLTIPVAVFAFNHSPIISSLAVAKQKEYGNQLAEQKCSQIIKYSNILMVVTVMFFVFSCALSLSPVDLKQAKAENITILSYLANHFHTPVLKIIAPIVAFIAICKSFLGHYLGAKEGFNGLLNKSIVCFSDKPLDHKTLDRCALIFIYLVTWIVSSNNPSVLDIIESIAGPILAVILFILPMVAIHTVPNLAKYKGKWSNIFITIMGCIAISATVYQFFI